MRRRTRRRVLWVAVAGVLLFTGGCADVLLADVQARTSSAPAAEPG